LFELWANHQQRFVVHESGILREMWVKIRVAGEKSP
jgi:hypothetical protein